MERWRAGRSGADVRLPAPTQAAGKQHRYSDSSSWRLRPGSLSVIGEQTAGRKRVLLIEDSLDTAHTMVFLMRDAGYSVEFAINGYAALTVAERQRPDIVLVDMGLPDFDGIALIRRLKRLPELAHARIIAMTGRVTDDD